MKTKEEIATNWLPRYTDTPLETFGQYLLTTNFVSYVEEFASLENCEIRGCNRPMQTATSKDGITIINFGMGSPNAATLCDLLSVIAPRAILFLGKCGGLRNFINVGDFILPMAAIRGEGTSDSYYPPEVPALPSFELLKSTSHVILDNGLQYHTGVVYTTNRRLWEHDDKFKEYLRDLRCIAIDMETATFFIASFANHIPHGAFLLCSDVPMTPDGVKTDKGDAEVTKQFASQHLEIGLETLRRLQITGKSVRHFIFGEQFNAGSD